MRAWSAGRSQVLRRVVPDRLSPQLAVWILPVIVFVAVRRSSDHRMTLAVGVVVAIIIVVMASKRPAGSLVLLLAILPFHVVVLAGLYRLGAPAGLVKNLSSYRDLLIIGVGVAGYREFRRRGDRTDVLDKVAIAYLVVTTLYLALPNLFTRPPSATFAGAPQDLNVRLLAYRVDVSLVVLMLAARHAPVGQESRDRLMRVLLVVGTVVAAITVFEFFASSAWNTFLVKVIEVPRYLAQVVREPNPHPTDLRTFIGIAGHKLDRPGSTFVDPLSNGFFLVIPFGLGLQRVLRQRGQLAYAATGLIALALLFTNVRAAMLAAIIGCLVAIRQGAGGSASRVRVGLLLAIGVILLAPAAGSSGLASRASNATNNQDESTHAHLNSLRAGLHALATDPLGRGLGTQPGIGDRFTTKTKLTSEDAYLQVGNELGIETLILFALMTILLLRRLRVAAQRDPSAPLPSATRAIGFGLAIAGLFLHVWIYYAVALTFWGTAGIVLGVSERSADTPMLQSAQR